MPAFYALAQHAALTDLQSQLLDGEAIFAFLDDVYVVSAPERVRTIYDALAAALWHSARIRLHEGKTRIWNSAGEEPSNIADLSGDDGAEPVWVGDWSLPPECHGITVLGSPSGTMLLSPGTWSANARTTTGFSSVWPRRFAGRLAVATVLRRPACQLLAAHLAPPPHRHLCRSTRCSHRPLPGHTP